MADNHLPNIGVVGVENGWSSELLASRVEERTGRRLLIDMDKVQLDLGRRRVFFGDRDLTALDALIVKKLGRFYRPELLDRLEILHFLAAGGVRIFSSPVAIGRLLDRLSCTVTLQLGGIPMPDTIVTEDLDAAFEAVRRFERAVLKPLFTTKARGMELVTDGNGVRRQLEDYRARGNQVIYVQRLVDTPGADLGVAFLGGEYMSTYARVARPSSWNTSTTSGARYEPYVPADEVIELARRAQALFDLDFTCVDVVETANGPLVFEVSAFGGFRGMYEACGIDAAKAYVDYVLEKLRNRA